MERRVLLLVLVDERQDQVVPLLQGEGGDLGEQSGRLDLESEVESLLKHVQSEELEHQSGEGVLHCVQEVVVSWSSLGHFVENIELLLAQHQVFNVLWVP